MLTPFLLFGCAPTGTLEPTDTGGPSCDGRYQAGEGDGLDAAYDRDQDGYVDANNQGCVANYGANRLDCDDDDPTIHPDALEVQCNDIDEDCNPDTLDALDGDLDGTPGCYDCDDDDPLRSPIAEDVCWDGIDNDCDTRIDQDCGPNYGGNFVLSQRIRYGCSLGLVSIDFDEVSVLWDPPYASIYSVDSGQPGTLQGSIAEDGTFLYEVDIDLGTAASCAESYTITGQYLDEDNLVFDFDARFIPAAAGACLGCERQTWTGITGVRSSSF